MWAAFDVYGRMRSYIHTKNLFLKINKKVEEQ
jgi:hypothetical protein